MALCIPSHVPLDRLPSATGLHLLFSGMFYIFMGPVVGKNIFASKLIRLTTLNNSFDHRFRSRSLQQLYNHAPLSQHHHLHLRHFVGAREVFPREKGAKVARARERRRMRNFAKCLTERKLKIKILIRLNRFTADEDCVTFQCRFV
jgi:hypothetical protein